MDLPPSISTPRLSLTRPHPPTFALAAEIFAAIDRSRDNLHRWAPFCDAILRPEDEFLFLAGPCDKGWEIRRSFLYLIRLADTGEFAGTVTLRNVDAANRSAEIGYWLDDAHVGRGFMREAVSALERAAFDAGLHRCFILNDPRNARSVNVALATGHRLDGVLRHDRFDPATGAYSDTNVFSRLSTDP